METTNIFSLSERRFMPNDEALPVLGHGSHTPGEVAAITNRRAEALRARGYMINRYEWYGFVAIHPKRYRVVMYVTQSSGKDNLHGILCEYLPEDGTDLNRSLLLNAAVRPSQPILLYSSADAIHYIKRHDIAKMLSEQLDDEITLVKAQPCELVPLEYEC